jgi:hypothetical protein
VKASYIKIEPSTHKHSEQLHTAQRNKPTQQNVSNITAAEIEQLNIHKLSYKQNTNIIHYTLQIHQTRAYK